MAKRFRESGGVPERSALQAEEAARVKYWRDLLGRAEGPQGRLPVLVRLIKATNSGEISVDVVRKVVGTGIVLKELDLAYGRFLRGGNPVSRETEVDIRLGHRFVEHVIHQVSKGVRSPEAILDTWILGVSPSVSEALKKSIIRYAETDDRDRLKRSIVKTILATRKRLGIENPVGAKRSYTRSTTMTPEALRKWFSEMTPAQKEKFREGLRMRRATAELFGHRYSQELLKVARKLNTTTQIKNPKKENLSLESIMRKELRFPKVGAYQVCSLCGKAKARFLGVKGGKGQWIWPPEHQTIEQCRALWKNPMSLYESLLRKVKARNPRPRRTLVDRRLKMQVGDTVKIKPSGRRVILDESGVVIPPGTRGTVQRLYYDIGWLATVQTPLGSFYLKLSDLEWVTSDPMSSKNPVSLYESFHGNPPARQRKVSLPEPKGNLTSIGRLVALEYEPYPPSKHSTTRFRHEMGDEGKGTILKEKPVLASDGKGRLFIVPDKARPKFGSRGIAG